MWKLRLLDMVSNHRKIQKNNIYTLCFFIVIFIQLFHSVVMDGINGRLKTVKEETKTIAI